MTHVVKFTWLCGLLISVSLLNASVCYAQYEEASLEEILEAADSKDDKERREALYELVRRGESSSESIGVLTSHVDDGDRQVRYLSLLGLARAGEAAASAVPELLAALRNRDDQVRFRATDALAKIGERALSEMIEAWPNASTSTRICLAQAMGEMGQTIAPRKEELMKLFAESGGDPELEYYTAECLTKLTPDDEALLLSLVTHAEGRVRELGIRCLANLEQPTESAEKALVSAANDAGAKVRELGVIAVAKSRMDLATKARILSAGILDSDRSVRVAALTGLRKAKSSTPAFSLPIADLLEDAADKADSSELTSSLLEAMLVLGPKQERDLQPLLALASEGLVDQALLSRLVGRMGPAAVAKLIQELGRKPGLRSVMEQALIDNVSVNELAIREGLQSNSVAVRCACAQAITQLTPVTSETVHTLRSLLEEDSQELRTAGLEALARCAAAGGTLDETTLQSIVACGNDDDTQVRIALARQLQAYPFDEPQRRQLFLELLSDNDPQVRAAGLLELANQSADLAGLKREVMVNAEHARASVRRAAADALGNLKGNDVDEQVTSLLSGALSDPETSVRIAATESLSRLGLGVEELRPQLLERLGQNLADDEDLLRATLAALRLAEEDAATTSPVVAALLDHPREDIRVNAVKTLREISKDRELLATQLTACLDDQQWTVRQASAEALGSMGEIAKVAVPKLFSKLGDEEDEDFARGAIREIDAAPAEMLPDLLEGLESDERRKQFYSVFLIGKIGPAASEALPQLKELRNNANGDRSLSFLKRFLDEAIKSIED